MSVSWLDRLPAPVHHLLLLLLPVLLGWAGTDLVPVLQGVNPVVGMLATALLAYLVSWATPLTRLYGVGSAKPRV